MHTSLALFLVLLGSPGDRPVAPPAPVAPIPEARQLAWQDLETCAFVHFGPNTFTGKEWGQGTEDPSIFNPTALDCRQWCRIFRDAGMKGVVITAKHHDGFCLWPSRFTAHTVAASPWKGGQGDVLRELSDACREFGLSFGVYLSPWDRNHPLYGTGDPYNEAYRGQLREVLTGYGPVFEVWFDGACGEGPNGKRQVYDFPSFEAVVRECQPNAVMFSDVGPDIRWVGNEEGEAGETNWSMMTTAGHGRGNDNPPAHRALYGGELEGERWIPAECDVSIRPGWFWRENENDSVKSAEKLFDLYERSVGRNGSLLLNVPADQRGLINEIDAARLMGMRRLIDATYGHDLAAGRSAIASNVRGNDDRFAATNVTDGDATTYWATDDGTTTAAVEIDLGGTFEVDRLMLQEAIALGQRIEAFHVELRVDGTWMDAGQGTTVGHKRIMVMPRVKADAVRVTIDRARACPTLTRVGVFATPADPRAAAAGP